VIVHTWLAAADRCRRSRPACQVVNMLTGLSAAVSGIFCFWYRKITKRIDWQTLKLFFSDFFHVVYKFGEQIFYVLPFSRYKPWWQRQTGRRNGQTDKEGEPGNLWCSTCDWAHKGDVQLLRSGQAVLRILGIFCWYFLVGNFGIFSGPFESKTFYVRNKNWRKIIENYSLRKRQHTDRWTDWGNA